MNRKTESTPESPPLNNGGAHIPPKMIEALEKFVLDKFTGNVRISIQKGKILGYRTEELFTL